MINPVEGIYDIGKAHLDGSFNQFGLGNSTIKEPELFDADYYKVNVKGLMTSLYAENEIFKKGLFRLGLMFENFNSVSPTY